MPLRPGSADDMAHLWLDTEVEGHLVTLGVEGFGVVIWVDWGVEKINAPNATKVRIALAARRLWQRALVVLPPGVYHCHPLCEGRKKVYLAAGWRPSPVGRGDELVYYHLIPPLPEGWMNWKPPC